MAGIGDYAKGKKFTLKSGNKPSGFKMMGSSPVKKGFLKKAGDAYVGALKTSGEGFLKGGVLGALGAQLAAGMNKGKEEPKDKKENKSNLDMTDVADNLKKTSPNKSVDDKLNEVKTRRGSAGTYDINSLSFSPQEKNPDLEEQIKKNQKVKIKSREEKSRKEETVEGGRLSPEQLQKNKDAEAAKVKKTEKKASRKKWRKDTGKVIASKAGEVVKDAATNALTKALTPKETKRVNPTSGFNVQFGNKR